MYVCVCSRRMGGSEIAESTLGGELSCPHCGKLVKLNPFTIEGDWKPIAEAWQLSENKR